MPLVNDLLPYGDTVAHVHNAIFANFPSLYIHFNFTNVTNHLVTFARY